MSVGGPDRRRVLAGLAGVAGLAGAVGLGGLGVLGTACSATTEPVSGRSSASRPGQTARVEPIRHAYGSDPSQFGELHLPTGARQAGTVVVLHGGFWRAQYGLDLGRPLAADLAARGYVAWNLEYRRVGSGAGGGGGWPATLSDVAAGIDALAGLGHDLDLSRVVAIGHSAGGQLAAWAASRPGQPADAPGSSPRVRVTAVVSQAGVLDLRHAAQTGVGGSAVSDLLGGSPSERSSRYDEASPIERVPLGVPVVCVHGRSDDTVPFDQSTRYVDAARRAGDEASVVAVDGDHFVLIDVTSAAWTAVVERLPGLLGH